MVATIRSANNALLPLRPHVGKNRCFGGAEEARGRRPEARGQRGKETTEHGPRTTEP